MTSRASTAVLDGCQVPGMFDSVADAGHETPSPRCSLDGNQIGDAGATALSEVVKIGASFPGLTPPSAPPRKSELLPPSP
jgi:hypothetical protein